MELSSAAFCIALLQIIWVNILLSSNNAVVIALAACSLPAAQQKKAITIGSDAAIVMRIVFTLVAAKLLLLPEIAAIALTHVGRSLVVGVHRGIPLVSRRRGRCGQQGARYVVHGDPDYYDRRSGLSLDNVVAVAAAAMGDTTLLVLGLMISIPLVIFGSALLLKVIERFPIIVWVGAAILGFIVGELLVGDPALQTSIACLDGYWGISEHHSGVMSGAAGAVLVLALGIFFLRRQKAELQ